MLRDIALRKGGRNERAPSNGCTRDIKQDVILTDMSARHLVVRGTRDQGHIVESETVIVDILRSQKRNALFLVDRFSTKGRTTCAELAREPSHADCFPGSGNRERNIVGCYGLK